MKDNAPRTARDGAISVARLDDESICIDVTDNGVEGSVTMSEYNARRVLGALSVMLGIAINKADAKKIKL